MPKSDPPPVIYWDACCFIDCLQGTKGRFDVLDLLSSYAKEGKIKLVSSYVVKTEVLRLGKEIRPEDLGNLNQIDANFREWKVIFRNLDRSIVDLATRLRIEHGLGSLDAIHLATAVFYRLRIVHTYDEKLISKDGMLGDPPVRIHYPKDPFPNLFGPKKD